MQYGIHLLSAAWPGSTQEAVFQSLLGQVRTARDSGLNSVWTGAGLLMGGMDNQMLMARLSAESGDMSLGNLALLPLEHPVWLAEKWATLDTMCGGRLMAGVGLAWRDFHFTAFGVEKRTRLARFLEALELLKRLWTEERVEHHSNHYDVSVERPVYRTKQQPHPPILYAAHLDAGVVRSVDVADGWLCSSRAIYSTINRQIGLLESTASPLGKKPLITLWRDGFVGKDMKTALEVTRGPIMNLYGERASIGGSGELPPEDRIDLPFEELIKDRFVLGGPDECAQELKRYKDLGIDQVVIRMQWPGLDPEEVLNSIKLIGTRVIPQLG